MCLYVISKYVVLYKKYTKYIYIPKTFLLRDSLLNGLYTLKDTYGTPIYKLINLAIRLALIDEGYIEKK